MSLEISSRSLAVANPDVALKRSMRMAAILLGSLVIGLGGLVALVQITGAVVAYGDVSVASKVKKIAHPGGGVVAEIRVSDGDRVKAGDILMRLDSTVTGANAEISGQGVDQLMAQRARLQAERDGTPLIFPPELIARANMPAAADAMRQETRLYQLRIQERAGLKSQLIERITQFEEQIRGYQGQAAANRQQAALVEGELEGARELFAKNLVTISRLNALERAAVELRANASSVDANIAQTRARITEIRQQMIQVDQQVRSEAGVDLSRITGSLGEQQGRQITAQDAYERSLIRAPQSGVVDKLAFNTIGGVVPPAQTILEIVPDSDELTVVARVSPADIDQISLNQKASLRFSAFNTQTTPEIMGKLTRISAEAATDERTGASFYTVQVAILPDQLRKLGTLKLVPGMPVEVFIQTGRRSMLSYLTKPLTDQIKRSFREG